MSFKRVVDDGDVGNGMLQQYNNAFIQYLRLEDAHAMVILGFSEDWREPDTGLLFGDVGESTRCTSCNASFICVTFSI
jgi:hypothetical protein